MSKYKLFLTISLVAVLLGCAGDARRMEMNFANRLAERDLWEEALLHWEKILQSGRPSAALYNNMAIAHEKMGQLAEAEQFYQKALQLAPNNTHIKRNMEQLQRLLKGEPDQLEPDKKGRRGPTPPGKGDEPGKRRD